MQGRPTDAMQMIFGAEPSPSAPLSRKGIKLHSAAFCTQDSITIGLRRRVNSVDDDISSEDAVARNGDSGIVSYRARAQSVALQFGELRRFKPGTAGKLDSLYCPYTAIIFTSIA